MRNRNIALATSLIVATAAAATSALAQAGESPDRYGPYYYGHDMMWGGGQWGGFGMVLGPIFMILILLGIVAGIIYLVRLFGGTAPGGSGHAAHDRALALLKERYAKGEIDSGEFAERKKLLAD
ncbi:SHOCT domain-containing protein [Bauldia litoralis]|uniref:Putative membrane protein n=1 Tax=Bauldia litoralis TaxID=665467 RepID=A0A1G6CC87_9HYPH|nr:SHOCT domain-containing protein [Bauldia litoralis]SDB30490.1 putative membrane protein [Bauldia litoralis]